MEEKGLGENKLVRDLSKGVILEEYVIKFLKEYNLDSYVTITEFSNDGVNLLSVNELQKYTLIKIFNFSIILLSFLCHVKIL